MSELIFSWAETAEGKMVHVDDVSRGIECNCYCPNCHERLLARHGEINAHGFAHHSDQRSANLSNCYKVTMYKLAEHIIKVEKKLFVPPYYGIFKGQIVKFTEIQIDNRYIRNDNQRDIIAMTPDGILYLIELNFGDTVVRQKSVDYNNINCVKIDLSSATLDSLHELLLQSAENKSWFNNQLLFNDIESTYRKHGKIVKLTSEIECENCDFKYDCCGARLTGDSRVLTIEHFGSKYRICKIQELELRKDKIKSSTQMLKEQDKNAILETANIPHDMRSCFNCKRNLRWMKGSDKYARCSSYEILGVPKHTPPDTAKNCRGFIVKTQ